MNLNRHLILASSSPRRKELLEKAGFVFDVVHVPADESYSDQIPVREVAAHLASHKNKEAQNKLGGDSVIITADTIVLCDDIILGKPTDEHHAIEILTLLSGRSHLVITGVCISQGSDKVVFDDVTEVVFKDLSRDEIHHYVTTYHPMDKAGAYGIQEWIGLIGVQEIRGSYYNVVGLPLQKLYQVLTDQFNINRHPLH